MPFALKPGRVPAAAVLTLTAALIWACFTPGHMGVDTLGEVAEVASGDFTNRHAPLLHALWRPFYELGAGPGVILFLQIATFLTGGYLVLRVALKRLPAAVVTAAIALSPPVLGMLGSLTRDTWFTALLLLSYGLVAWAANRGVLRRVGWLIVLALVVWVTLASRQNAAPALVPLAAVIAYGLVRGESPVRRRLVDWASRRKLLAATVLGTAAVVCLMGTQLLAAKAIGVRDVNPEQYLYVYDLAAASEREHENLFPADVLPSQDLAVVEDNWRVDSMVFLVFGAPPPIAAPLEPRAMASLRDAWWQELSSDPLGYLETRTQLFSHLISIADKPIAVFLPDIEANDFGFEIWFPAANDVAIDYLSAFTSDYSDFFVNRFDGGPLHLVWIYLLIAAACVFVLLRRGRSPAEVTVGALALSAFTVQVGLYFGVMGTEYRFEFPAVAAALFALPVAIAVWRRRSPGPREP